MIEYICTATQNKLVRKPKMFYYRGQYFHGLMDGTALYDDPNDSAAAVMGFESSLGKGLIEVYKGESNAL